MQRKTFRIRPGVKITNTSQIEMTSGRTTSGEEESGENRIFEFLDDSGHYVKIAYTVWDNEERDIRPIEAEGSRPLERLNAGRLRLALYSIRNGSYRSVDNLFCVLRQARVKEESENQWSNLFNATPIELDEGAGLEVQKVLEKAGAIDIGTRKKILNERGRTRNQWCIVFEQKNELLPVVAFALTRILPLINEYPAPDNEEGH